MIKHVVILEVSPKIEEWKIESSLNKLGNLRFKENPQIHSFSYGKNCSPELLNKGFNYALVIEFMNTKDRNTYLEHEAHKLIGSNEIIPLLSTGIESVIVVDYEF